MSQGIVITGRDGRRQFDSRRRRFQAALDREPPHIDRVTVTGTALVTNAGNDFYSEEILHRVRHGLGYRPTPFVYYHQLVPFSGSDSFYSVGRLVYSSGVLEDYLGWEVTKNFLYIKHVVDDMASNLGHTSDAPDFGAIGVKYIICSNPLDDLHSLAT